MLGMSPRSQLLGNETTWPPIIWMLYNPTKSVMKLLWGIVAMHTMTGLDGGQCSL